MKYQLLTIIDRDYIGQTSIETDDRLIVATIQRENVNGKLPSPIVKVNWSAIGSVDLDVAEKFANDMLNVIKATREMV